MHSLRWLLVLGFIFGLPSVAHASPVTGGISEEQERFPSPGGPEDSADEEAEADAAVAHDLVADDGGSDDPVADEAEEEEEDEEDEEEEEEGLPSRGGAEDSAAAASFSETEEEKHGPPQDECSSDEETQGGWKKCLNRLACQRVKNSIQGCGGQEAKQYACEAAKKESSWERTLLCRYKDGKVAQKKCRDGLLVRAGVKPGNLAPSSHVKAVAIAACEVPEDERSIFLRNRHRNTRKLVRAVLGPASGQTAALAFAEDRAKTQSYYELVLACDADKNVRTCQDREKRKEKKKTELSEKVKSEALDAFQVFKNSQDCIGKCTEKHCKKECRDSRHKYKNNHANKVSKNLCSTSVGPEPLPRICPEPDGSSFSQTLPGMTAPGTLQERHDALFQEASEHAEGTAASGPEEVLAGKAAHQKAKGATAVEIGPMGTEHKLHGKAVHQKAKGATAIVREQKLSEETSKERHGALLQEASEHSEGTAAGGLEEVLAGKAAHQKAKGATAVEIGPLGTVHALHDGAGHADAHEKDEEDEEAALLEEESEHSEGTAGGKAVHQKAKGATAVEIGPTGAVHKLHGGAGHAEAHEKAKEEMAALLEEKSEHSEGMAGGKAPHQKAKGATVIVRQQKLSEETSKDRAAREKIV